MVNEEEVTVITRELIALREFRTTILVETREAFLEAVPEAIRQEREDPDGVAAVLLRAVVVNYAEAAYFQARNRENLDKLIEAKEEVEHLRGELRDEKSFFV